MADGDRRLRILELLVDGDTPGLETKRLCEVCAEVTGMSGAGIMLMSGDFPIGSLCTTNPVSALIEELQYTLGEGPCVDAHRLDRAVLESDLQNPATVRWPAFSGPAIDAGVRAVFGFPLQVGAIRLGALDLYCDRPGALTADQHADALILADVAAQAVLVMQADAVPGQLAAELEASSDFLYVVHQASGMVAVQLGVSVAQALVRLRAHAFATNQTITEVATAVVARTLKLADHDPDTQENGQ